MRGGGGFQFPPRAPCASVPYAQFARILLHTLFNCDNMRIWSL
jgi:hypothetical protein